MDYGQTKTPYGKVTKPVTHKQSAHNTSVHALQNISEHSHMMGNSELASESYRIHSSQQSANHG